MSIDIVQDRQERWDRGMEQAGRLMQQHGRHIDSAAQKTMTALNLFMIHSIGACGGHWGYGHPYPWIIIGLTERGQGSLINTLPILSLLDDFYANHPCSSDCRLILISRNNSDAFDLRSQGAAFQWARSEEDRLQKLAEYQQEMAAFTTFLKQRFFQS